DGGRFATLHVASFGYSERRTGQCSLRRHRSWTRSRREPDQRPATGRYHHRSAHHRPHGRGFVQHAVQVHTAMKKLALFAFIYSRLMALPVWFEPNQGQIAGRTEWIARSGDTEIYLAPNEAAYAL